ncbi:hypothetical protein PCYB_042790, partial [Plasmodium cynomolgi strain B]
MENTYKKNIKNMDAKWSSNIWNSVWAVYLENVHNFIGSKLNMSDFPLRDKEKIIET